MRVLAISAATILLAACGFVYDKPLVGPYRLVAIDTLEDMSLCLRTAESDCVGDGLPGSQVTQAGGNDSYVVVAVRPREIGSTAEPGVEEYYYIRRTAEEPVRRGVVEGPFTEAELAAEKSRLGLPEFSWRGP